MNYRKIMEKKKGRKLKPSEIVHHKDGNKYNNNPINLQLVSSSSKHSKIPKKKHKISKEEIKNLLAYTETLKSENFETAIRHLFTPYQISLIIKKTKREKLCKTDTEYFSRVIKKKLYAVANEQLHRIAKSACG